MQQEFKEYELIIVNDGSDDGTKEYLDSLLSNSRIKIIHQQQAGPAAARNAGIKIAKDEFIAFTDDDCVVPREWLRQLYLVFQSSQIDIVGGRVQNASPLNIYSEVSQETTNFFVQHLHEQNPNFGFLTSNNIAYRTATVRNVGGFDERFRFAGGEERALNQKIISKGGRSLFVRDIVVQHHQELTLRTYLRQQSCYGNGSFLLHKVLANEIPSSVRFIPFVMYLRLILSFLGDNFLKGVLKSFLFGIGQFGLISGFLAQAVRYFFRRK